jgi:hypothetical protein
MKRFCGWCTLSIVCSVAGLAAGRAPLIDPPTPPPCAADGTCYPNTGEWGYYPSRWRTWPGAQLEPTAAKSPTPAEGQISPELRHTETPPAELEDAAAPPSSPKHEEPAEGAPAEGAKQPAAESQPSTLPNVPLPDAESPPLGPTSENDPPPALPRSLSMRPTGTGTRQAAMLGGSHPAASGVSTGDPPPTPPWAQSASL